MGRHNLDSKLLRNTIISPWKYFLTKSWDLKMTSSCFKGRQPKRHSSCCCSKSSSVGSKLACWDHVPLQKGGRALLTLWGHFSPPGESELCNIFKFNFLLKEDSEFLLKVELIGLLVGTNKVERWDRESLDQFFTLFFYLYLKVTLRFWIFWVLGSNPFDSHQNQDHPKKMPGFEIYFM